MPKIPVNLRLEPGLLARVDQDATELNVTRTWVIEHVLEDAYGYRPGRKRVAPTSIASPPAAARSVERRSREVKPNWKG